MFDLESEHRRTNNCQIRLSCPHPLHHLLRSVNLVGCLSLFGRNPPLVPNALLSPMLAFVPWTNNTVNTGRPK